MGELFGTDGVRGEANSWPMTAEMALKLGAAAGRFFRTDGRNQHRVVIGKDTRLSGYMIENALTAGLTSTGMNVLLLGPVPTPAVGFLTRSMRADVGIMISASHNPAKDNGIKFFGPDGFKLSDESEAEIEALVAGEVRLAQPENIGRARRIEDGRGRYVEYAKTTFPSQHRLSGLKVVVDCANGAAYKAAPEVLWELGCEVIPVGVTPNGLNINERCGSTYIIRELDWDGLHPEEHDAVLARARADHGEDCPALTEDEAKLLIEASDALRNKLISAALYPAIVTLFAIVIVVFLMSYVVPQVATVFAGSKRALPMLTVIMLGLSNLVRQWGWLLALLLAAGGGRGGHDGRPN